MADSGMAAVYYLPVDNKGIVSKEVLAQVLGLSRKESVAAEKNILVSIMLANNEIGTIEPIKEFARIAHSNHAWFHTDAVQAVGHIPIDVKDLDVDLLSASAHKFNGPKGTGFLYVRRGTIIYPHNEGGAQEQGLRAGTENVAGIIGMAVALKENCKRIKENSKYIMGLENCLMEGIDSLDFIRNGAPSHIPGNISLSFRGVKGEAILHRMDLRKICISTGSACDSVNTQVSHVINAISIPEDYAEGTIRITLGKNNTLEEAEMIANSLVEIVGSMLMR